MFYGELEARGWTCVGGITGRSELLELARSVGKPVPSPTGELIKELSPVLQPDGRKGTLSDTYAGGKFPLHTDTAFWPIPSRYILLRVRGDIRRCTTILTFTDLFRGGPDIMRTLASESVWLARTRSRSAYCSMRFRCGDAVGWRYDPQCMIPANSAAARVQKMVGSVLS